MATAISSALLKIPVRKDVAMTGEITLRGRVLPIGGLKEKILAAHRGKIKTIIMPKENEKDLKEIPKSVLKDIEIVLVEGMDDVLKHALAVKDPSKIFKRDDKADRGKKEVPLPPVAKKGRGAPRELVQQ
jgi:ATP-dependent Lon protease